MDEGLQGGTRQQRDCDEAEDDPASAIYSEFIQGSTPHERHKISTPLGCRYQSELNLSIYV